VERGICPIAEQLLRSVNRRLQLVGIWAYIISEEEAELQNIITAISDVCKEYGMEINVEKTKTMAIWKTGNLQCTINIMVGRVIFV